MENPEEQGAAEAAAPEEASAPQPAANEAAPPPLPSGPESERAPTEEGDASAPEGDAAAPEANGPLPAEPEGSARKVPPPLATELPPLWGTATPTATPAGSASKKKGRGGPEKDIVPPLEVGDATRVGPASNPLALRHERLQGTISKYVPSSGWGFIKSHLFEGELGFKTESVMLECQSYEFREGEGVEFDVQSDERGRPHAVAVKPIVGRKPNECLGQRHRGYVRRFADRWGFLNAAAFDGDLFVHRDNLLMVPDQMQEGQPPLRAGQAVEFDVALDDRGRTVAKQITTSALLRPCDWIGRRLQGYIRSFQGAWGFINSDRFAGDLFVHRDSLLSQFQAGVELIAGTVVEFDVERDHHKKGGKNRLVARQVVVLHQPNPIVQAPSPYGSAVAQQQMMQQVPQALDPMVYSTMPPPYGSALNPQAASFAPVQSPPMYYQSPQALSYGHHPYPYADPQYAQHQAIPSMQPPQYGQQMLQPGSQPHYGQPQLAQQQLGQQALAPTQLPQPPQTYLPQPPQYGQPQYGQPQLAQPQYSQQPYGQLAYGQPLASTVTQPGMGQAVLSGLPGLGGAGAPTAHATGAPGQVPGDVAASAAGGEAGSQADGQPQVLLHITTHDWEPDQSGQLRVRKGTLVNVSHRAAHGWVYATTVPQGNEAGELASEGWVPQAVAKRVSLCRVAADWPAEGTGTLGLLKLDLIAVSKEAERGWVYGERVNPKRPEWPADGWLPKKVLEYIVV